ncbi:apolipoprotein N-acyltransferase [Nocardioides gilvus]|uniref:apolipoprotein N-acyltransferase n=1 Tax=Nocardioides gilvus TaxID=1735589 RepID=UPI000D74E9BB|nr:apolipoprotein N-acyltransferase [Nocardioides gilvus]
MLLRVLLAAVAGVALAGASEPLAWTWLTLPSVAVLLLCVRGLAPRTAWLPSLTFGIAFFFVLQVWMRAVGTDAWIGLSALEAAFFVPLGLAFSVVGRSRWWPLWAAVCWVAVETVRGSWPFSGMPWGRLSYGVVDSVWAEGLPWYGFTGVSFLLALSGTVLAWLVADRPAARVGVPVVLVLAALTITPNVLTWDPRTEGSATVAAVQGDVPGSGDDLVAVHREVTRNHVEATVALAADVRSGAAPALDFVLWPENSTAVDPFRDTQVNTGIERAVTAIGVPVLVGAMVDAPESHQVLNQGIVWDPRTGPGDRYTKRWPVPFGEYIPWREVVFKENLGQLRQIGRDMLSGTRPSPLVVGGIQVADAICFDVAYDEGLHTQIRNGAQLVTVQTSNAMFIRTHQIEQQYAITRLRALETGRAVAVAATNGLTGVIDPRGRVLAEADPRTTSAVVHEVGLSSRVTPAVWLGVWPGRVAVVLAVLLTLALGPLRGRVPYARRARPIRGSQA